MFGESSYQSFVPEKFIVGISGQYHDMVSRPFVMHTSQNALDNLMLNTNNGLNITQESVQLEQDAIIRLAGEAQGVLDIEGSWGTSRNVFVLVLRNVNDNSKFILSGFTSPDFLHGNNINDYAQLKFNNVVELSAVQDMSGQISYRMHNSDSILTSNALMGGTGGSFTQPQRPTDVINNAILRGETMAQSSATVEDDTPIVSMGISELGGNGTKAPELGRATNASANDYLYRTARAFTDASLTGTSDDDITHTLQGMATNNILSEGSYSSMPLINTLLTNAGSRRGAYTTFGELRDTLPDLPQVTQVLNGDSGSSMDGMEHWKGRGATGMIAEFAAAIPAIMMKLGINHIGFQMTSADASYGMDGYSNTFSLKQDLQMGGVMLSFLIPEIPQMEAQAAFTAYMRNVVFPSIAKHHNVVIDVTCGLTKDLVISASIDGSNVKTWAGPTFCSSLWNPTGATTLQSNTNMANGMLQLTQHIHNSQNGMASQQQSSAQEYASSQFGMGDSMTVDHGTGSLV